MPVPEENELGIGGNRLNEFGEHGQIQHGGLVDDHKLEGQGMFPVVPELAGKSFVSQEAVHRGGLEIQRFHIHGQEAFFQRLLRALGRFSSRGSQGNTGFHVFHARYTLRDKGRYSSGFARAGASGNQSQA